MGNAGFGGLNLVLKVILSEVTVQCVIVNYRHGSCTLLTQFVFNFVVLKVWQNFENFCNSYFVFALRKQSSPNCFVITVWKFEKKRRRKKQKMLIPILGN
jgi:hypothetical protein